MKTILNASKVIACDGSNPINNGSVIIEGDQITKVPAQDKITEADRLGSREYNFSDGTIIPGFIEMHSHIHCSAHPTDAYKHITTESNETFIIRGTQALRSALMSGVTTMRDLGSRNEVIFPLRNALAAGTIPGPRLLAAGTPITTTGGHCNSFGTEADTSQEVVQAVRNQFKLGADCIKMMSTGGGFTPGTNVRKPQYSADIIRDAVVDADRLGLKVSAHCHGTAGIKNCVDAGIHNLIHCSWMSENPDELYDYIPELADRIADNNIYVDPTLALSHLNKIRGKKPSPASGMASNPERRFEILRDMWDRGIKFVTGMDSGMANANFDDFPYIPEVMVKEMKITPMEALVCATKTSAECLGLSDQIGTLQKGKSADILVVNGDPLVDITKLHDINTIIAQGKNIKLENKFLI